ncbi:MAG TPA: TrpB-like pyridoxal phosphate-dependent enzyme [Spirochaetota bacterium]|jgi:tryptophan synthase beta chain|nr:TrpB-like pyridoxal phosphate-dependent enzyme [Spirochaetota bacterium]
MIERKILLEDRELPRHWFNPNPYLIQLKTPFLPPMNPETNAPLPPEALERIFAKELVAQDGNITDKLIAIPEEVLKIYSLWRPTPMFRAGRLEEKIGTRSKIYYKYEGVSPAGSHKPNTAVPQAYYNAKQGIKYLTTETGAGQWGSSLAFACQYFDITCKVFMVRCSYDMKPYRRLMMQTWGAECIPSPSPYTKYGKEIYEQDPAHPGSLGIAISEAVEIAAERDDTNYTLGSVLNHVLLHQTIIGEEVKLQLKKEGIEPDVLIACCGGGSNLGGLILPFLPDKMDGKNIKMLAVEPSACPTLTKGEYTWDFGDGAHYTPLVKMYTLGNQFVPAPVHAGGLRYHGDSPIISQLHKEGIVDAVAYQQREVFDAAVLFARTEGIIPAPESAHAIKGAIDEAKRADEEGKEKTIIFCLSGHGHFDLASYQIYFEGKMEDYEMPDEIIKKNLAELPKRELVMHK